MKWPAERDTADHYQQGTMLDNVPLSMVVHFHLQVYEGNTANMAIINAKVNV